MDTFVVLPKELFLSVSRYVSANGDEDPRGLSDRRPTRPAWGLSVWTAVPLQAGTQFSTTQETTVMVRLGCAVGNRHHPQVWTNFGCYEEIRLGPKHYERHCNWVCFLQSAANRDDANIVVFKVKERGIFWPTIQYQSAASMPLGAGEFSALCYPSRVPLGDGRKDVPLWASPRRGKERTALPCEVCGKSFDRPSLLRRHMRTHTGEKPHSCSVCGKAFSTSSSLNTHCRIHSGEKPHVCGVCGKRFTASSNLYYHRMTHRKDKPHKCTMCCKSFPTPGDLRSHMFVHNGSWPFKCQFCNRGFSKHTNLKNHVMLHTGEKPHVCVLCGKRFALICNLKSHSKTHQPRQHTVPYRSHSKPTTFSGQR